jgi:hypothetical protein
VPRCGLGTRGVGEMVSVGRVTDCAQFAHITVHVCTFFDENK